MTTALLRWSHPKATPALLPHCLFSLRQQCHTLYPIDVVCVLPSLLRALHEAELQLQHNNNSNNQNENENHVVEEGWLTTLPPTELEYLLVLLHRAYDGCRTFFLFLYKDVRTTPVEENQVALALPTALTHIEDIEQYSEAYRARFTHKIRTSILVVPKVYFVTVLVELCHSGMHDTPLATVCADRLLHEKERTVLRGRLSAEELTELFLSVCFHFLKSAGETSEDTATNDDVDGRHYLLPVLDALWERVEELEVKHIHAIRRCLFYYFEREKIDEDFLERLENQIQTIQHMDRQIKEKKRNMERAVADRIKEEKKESVSPLEQKATAPPAESVSMTADDLFDL
ncbi:hypothetical protein ADEAN_000875700 [Angomonas deanei]|uniref:Uncharacterized protein n=1 Tax=Angomonas deanei TaxID=59799 RepID=A0A7G2CN11_9TRYP|nr:hypothetical protein ADEAN_000875700 [Angomonas deanei]